jgi:hypothetical protein
MPSIKIIVLFSILGTVLFSCERDEDITPSKTYLRYEIFSSAPLADTLNNGKISFTDSIGNQQIDSNFINGTNSWSRTIDISAVSKPFSVSLNTTGRFFVTHSGNAVAKIYINGVLATSINGSIQNSGNAYYLSLPALNYVVQ